MVKEDIIRRFRYDMAMLTFDPMTGEDCNPSRHGDDAEELYQAIKSAIEYMENSEIVVHCKDCNFARIDKAKKSAHCLRCDWHGMPTMEYYYCASGERKEE